MQNPLLDRLLTSDEPAIRYKTRVQILKENPRSPAIAPLQEEIRRSHACSAYFQAEPLMDRLSQ